MRLSKSSDELNSREEVPLLNEQREATAFITRLEHLISVQVVRGADLLSMERL